MRRLGTVGLVWLLSALGAAAVPVAVAQDLRSETVGLDRESGRRVIAGSIRGSEIVDYRLNAAAGQQLIVELASDNLSNYFNLLAPGTSTALHSGSRDGKLYAALLPDDGDYRIRVYLMRNAARRDETARYRLTVDLRTLDADVARDLADGPAFWAVSGLSPGTRLNLRSGPSTDHEVLVGLDEGTVVRNRGCILTERRRWCRIDRAPAGRSGWVAGDYLREATPPAAADQASGGAPGLPVGNGEGFDAMGQLPCSPTLGQPARNCAFGVVRELSRQSTGLWIAIGGGKERYFLFENGAPVFSDAPGEIEVERQGDLNLIRVGGERYEVPDAVITGG